MEKLQHSLVRADAMRKRTRRKVYALVNPIAYAIEGATITDQPALDKLQLLELAAIDAFARGVASVDDWRSIADMCNIAQTMADAGIGHEVMGTCAEVEMALQRAYGRYKTHGKLGVDALGLMAMRDLHEYHSLQRTSVDRSTYEACIRKTANKIRGKHPSVKVMLDKQH